MNNVVGYCSNCLEKTQHILINSNSVSRNLYECQRCETRTVNCLAIDCTNMALASNSNQKNFEKEDSARYKFTRYINDGYCSEHNGAVANFDNLNMTLKDMSSHHKIWDNKKKNYSRILKISSGVVIGIIVGGTTFYFSAPALASAIGANSMGLMSASTGTAINTLSGATLTKSSLAFIGGGAIHTGGILSFGQAGGTAVISGIGAILGGKEGASIVKAYHDEVEDFDVKKLTKNNSYTKSSAIFINGFLNQDIVTFNDWLKGIGLKFSYAKTYGVTWESKHNRDIGKLLTGDKAKKLFIKLLRNAAKRGSKQFGKKIASIGYITSLSDIIKNPWTVAKVKADMTAALLAEIISRREENSLIDLYGHSLGCRVISNTLQSLSTKDKKIIRNVYLFGGAVSREPDIWKNCSDAVVGKIYNCYSDNDWVLKYLYKYAEFGDKPIGLGHIKRNEKVININVTDIIESHNDYKPSLPKVLEFINEVYPVQGNWWDRLKVYCLVLSRNLCDHLNNWYSRISNFLNRIYKKLVNEN